MKSKHLFQVFVLIAVLFCSVGGAQPVSAQAPDPVIVVRELTFWDATFAGYVDDTRYESWPLVLDATYDFSITASTTSGDLVPLVILQDSTGAEITSAAGSLTTNQPAGNYFIQIQPSSGSGFYELMIRKVTVESTSTTVPSDTITVDETTTVTVSLNNVPAEGYASAEFTCTYDSTIVQVSNIVIASLFGTDPAVAIFDPQNGTFIVAIAGSNGQKATTSGTAFTFDVTGLQVGQTEIICTARVSYGDDGLTDLPATGTTLTVEESTGTLTGKVLARKTVTVSLYYPDTTLAASVTANPDGTFSMTVPAGTYTVTASASGHLIAEGAAIITAGLTTTKSTVTLLAGDIDGNGVIDQYDALTIGMNYNGATPEAADLNGDATINVLDLEILASNYRATGPIAWP